MVSRAGLAVRFDEDDARAMGRDTSGVRGMDVAQEGNDVAGDGRRARRPWTCWWSPRTASASARRSSEYRKTRAAPRASRRSRFTEKRGGSPARARRARAPGAACSSPRTAWSSAPACAGSASYGPLGPGRDGHERRATTTACRRWRWWSSPRPPLRRWSDDDRSRASTPSRTALRTARRQDRSRSTPAPTADRTTGTPTTRVRRELPRRDRVVAAGLGNLGSPEKGGGPYRRVQFLRDPGGDRPLGRRLEPRSGIQPGPPSDGMPESGPPGSVYRRPDPLSSQAVRHARRPAHAPASLLCRVTQHRARRCGRGAWSLDAAAARRAGVVASSSDRTSKRGDDVVVGMVLGVGRTASATRWP